MIKWEAGSKQKSNDASQRTHISDQKLHLPSPVGFQQNLQMPDRQTQKDELSFVHHSLNLLKRVIITLFLLTEMVWIPL